MQDYSTPQVPTAKSPPNKHLTPTDIAQFLRLGECHRYLKMRQHERRKGNGFLHKYGVAPQAIPPLLTLSGQQFEQHIEEAARQKFNVIHCGEEALDNAVEEKDAAKVLRGEAPQARVDNQLVIRLARTLPCGEAVLIFQPRLEAVLGNWDFTGDLDILRLDRDDVGKLTALIVDMKSTTKVKLEHRLQVAFYHDMLVSVLGNANVAFAKMDLGIVYRGPSRAQGNTMTEEEMIQQAAAQRFLGVPDALLEVIADPENYLWEVKEMVFGMDCVINRIATAKFLDTAFHLTYKCDGCLYQQWCMKAAFQNDDLSLIPTLTASEKRTLHRLGLTTTAEVAALMEITLSPAGKPRLVPAEGQEKTVQALRSSPAGSRLSEIIHRAKSVSQSRRREIEKAEARREHASPETVIAGIEEREIAA